MSFKWGSPVHYGFDGDTLIEPVSKTMAWTNRSTNVANRWYSGEWASQSPMSFFQLATDGGGAEGTPGYLALPGSDSDEFYIEVTPVWWTPSVVFDLRKTAVSFYLKEITPLSVAPGYMPYLFVAQYVADTRYITGWYLPSPLNIGKDEWEYNRIVLRPDSEWRNYACAHPDVRPSIDTVLSRCGFLGVMYFKDGKYRGVRATGVLGIDEFRFNEAAS